MKLKAKLLDLDGKYYGTKVEVQMSLDSTNIEIWTFDWGNMEAQRPSSRQLEKWRMSYDEARQDDMMCDSHYESTIGFKIAQAIQRALDGLEV